MHTMANFKSAHTIKKGDKVNIYDEVKTVSSVYIDDEMDYVLIEFTDNTEMETFRMGQYEVI